MPQLNRCETCKWWNAKVVDPAFGPKGYRACTNREKLGEEASETSGDSLVYPYDEGTWLYAGPKFGCVHHEAEA